MLEPNSKPVGILNDAFETLVVRILGIALIFGMTALTARLLGPDEYGMFSAAMSLAILVSTVIPMGSDRILVRSLSTIRSLQEAGPDISLAHACSGLMAMAALGLISVLALAQTVVEIPGDMVRTCLLATVMFVPITLTYLRQWAAIPLTGTRAAVLPEQILLPTLFIGVLVALRLLRIPVTSTVTILLFAATMMAVWCLSLLSARVRPAYRAAVHARPTMSAVLHRLRDGLPFVSVSIGGVVLTRCLPLVIAATCGFEANGKFALAVQYAALPAIPLGVINLCTIPRCARHYHLEEMDLANHLVRRVATLTFLLATILALGTWLISPLLVRVLGDSYAGIGSLLPLLLLASIADSVAGPASPVMQTMKLERIYSRALYSFIPLQLGMIWLGSLYADLEGAAVAYLAGRILWAGLCVIIIFRTRSILSIPYLRVGRALSGSRIFTLPSVLTRLAPLRKSA